MILQEKKIVDHELFTEIYQQYYKDIFRFIYSYIVNIKDTEDLVQQVFTKLYNHMYLFKNADENVKKWLFKVAMNEAKNNLNSYWKKHKIDCIELEQEPAKEMETDLAFCLKKLPKKYRLALYFYYYEGYSIKEIAKIMKVTESGIKTRLKRGKEKLKKEMGGD